MGSRNPKFLMLLVLGTNVSLLNTRQWASKYNKAQKDNSNKPLTQNKAIQNTPTKGLVGTIHLLVSKPPSPLPLNNSLSNYTWKERVLRDLCLALYSSRSKEDKWWDEMRWDEMRWDEMRWDDGTCFIKNKGLKKFRNLHFCCHLLCEKLQQSRLYPAPPETAEWHSSEAFTQMASVRQSNCTKTNYIDSILKPLVYNYKAC